MGTVVTRSNDFSLAALYEALDAQRIARGLSWSQAAAEINRVSARRAVHPVSPSTVTGTRTKTVAEADGVLQMLLWLNRSPESFVPGHRKSEESDTRLPAVAGHQILRFDTRRLHAAINSQRIERSLTWAQVARELALVVSSLTHLANGGRTGFPQVMRITGWLGRPAADFTRAADW
jgi:hypothetical protein